MQHIMLNAPDWRRLLFILLFLSILALFFSCKETYYLRVEEVVLDYRTTKGEWLFGDSIVFHPEYYTNVVDLDNDSLIKKGYTPVRAVNYKRAYKKYYNGTYIPSFSIPK